MEIWRNDFMRRSVNWFNAESIAEYQAQLERERRATRRRERREMARDITLEFIAAIGMVVLFALVCTLFLIGG
jgi:hypothetical protein